MIYCVSLKAAGLTALHCHGSEWYNSCGMENVHWWMGAASRNALRAFLTAADNPASW